MYLTRKHLLLTVVFLTLTFILIPQTSNAQWSLGVAYELRDEDPKNGFGARLEKEILTILPLINVGLRAQFSYFSEQSFFSENGFDTERDLKTFDIGLSGLLIFNIGLLRPYAGIGVGLDNTSFESFTSSDDPNNSFREDIESLNAYLLGTAGAYVDVLPFLSPFIEFRYTQLSGREDFEYNSYSRIAAGLSIRF